MRNPLPYLGLLFLCSITSAYSAERPATTPSEQFRAVVSDYWNDLLRRHPIEATVYIGDHRYDDRLNDVSLAAYREWLGKLRETRKSLEELDTKSLSPEEQINRDVLAGMLDDRIELERFGDHLIPIIPLVRASTDIHSDDLHLVFSQLGDFQPAATVGDVENFVRRLRAFSKMADELIAVLKECISRKKMPPKVVVTRLLTQLKSLANPNPTESPLWTYTTRLPNDWRKAEHKKAIRKIRRAIKEDVSPAYARLAEFVEKTYLPSSRESIGLSATENGEEHYKALVRHYTTTKLTPEQIHQIGLTELAKTRASMEDIRKKVGFEGDLKAFLTSVRNDPKFKNRDAQSILDGHRQIVATMEKNLSKLFGTIPATPVEVRAFDPIRAKSSPTGEYLPVPSDGSRPGIFYVNTSDPTTRPTYTMQALAYHEALPGHHLQGAIALETPGRPPFRHFFYLPAFDEGWALYSEGLPAEIGLYTDPYAMFGRLNFDAHRCVRLIIDTGIHAKGWTRDQAIAFFEANTSLPRNEIENEVDRYIGWPGQALAYKIGELTIRRLREETSNREKTKFDLRQFHDRMLAYGSLPLYILERLMSQPDPSPKP